MQILLCSCTHQQKRLLSSTDNATVPLQVLVPTFLSFGSNGPNGELISSAVNHDLKRTLMKATNVMVLPFIDKRTVPVKGEHAR